MTNLLIFAVILSCVILTCSAGWYTSSNSTVHVNTRNVKPSARGLDMYLTPGSCLGYLGPIGPYGPLGLLGPIGSNSWNPSYWISAFDWSDWNKKISGPLSEDGPLGHNGPLTQTALYTTMPAINDFTHQMLPSGLFSVLGPLGVLGALGPLGPLGPIGAHGFTVDSHGSYVKGGSVVRLVKVPYDRTTTRTFELFEKYTQKYAAHQTDPDTSYMVEATWESGQVKENLYPIFSATQQVVTVVVVPNAQLDSFKLTIWDGRTSQIVTSSVELEYISWVQLLVPANSRLFAAVDLNYSGHLLSKGYRLFVVGGTSQFISTADVSGPQVLKY